MQSLLIPTPACNVCSAVAAWIGRATWVGSPASSALGRGGSTPSLGTGSAAPVADARKGRVL